jgi:hypothetical protein
LSFQAIDSEDSLQSMKVVYRKGARHDLQLATKLVLKESLKTDSLSVTIFKPNALQSIKTQAQPNIRKTQPLINIYQECITPASIFYLDS